VVQFQRLAFSARVFGVVEMSTGQLIEDVELALNGSRPVEFLSRVGGNVPSHEEVLALVRELARHGERARCDALAQPDRKEERMANVY
jgi:hypothetical protein